jgi:hypothetical protein
MKPNSVEGWSVYGPAFWEEGKNSFSSARKLQRSYNFDETTAISENKFSIIYFL